MKKRNSIQNIIIIILSLIVVGLIGYITYDKLSSKDNTPSEEKGTNIVETKNYDELIKEIEPVFEFAYNYFDVGSVYCGELNYGDYIKGTKTPSNGFRASKEYKSYQAMINYLKQYMSEEVINQKNSIKEEYYLEQNGKLYCEDLGKGGNIYQPENIIYQIKSSNNNIINVLAAVELSAGEYDKDYKNYNVTFTKIDNKWIITSYEKK